MDEWIWWILFVLQLRLRIRKWLHVQCLFSIYLWRLCQSLRIDFSLQLFHFQRKRLQILNFRIANSQTGCVRRLDPNVRFGSLTPQFRLANGRSDSDQFQLRCFNSWSFWLFSNSRFDNLRRLHCLLRSVSRLLQFLYFVYSWSLHIESGTEGKYTNSHVQ